MTKVEDFVDQCEKVPSRLENLIDADLLRKRWGGHVGLHQLRKAENGIERRAQLVTHAGQEFRFREIGRFGRRLGLVQFEFDALAFRHVALERRVAAQRTSCVADGRHDDVGPEGRAVFANPPAIVFGPVRGRSFLQRALGLVDGNIFLGKEARIVLADDFLGLVTLNALRAFIPAFHAAFLVEHDDRAIRHAFDHELEALLGPQPLVFGVFSHRVVGRDEQIADDRTAIGAQRGDRNDGRQTAFVLTDVSQLVNVLDSPRRLEHKRLEARRDLDRILLAECGGPQAQFERVGDIGRGNLVDDIGGSEPQHQLGAGIEQLNNPHFVGGDDGEIGAVQYGLLQRAGFHNQLVDADFGEADLAGIVGGSCGSGDIGVHGSLGFVEILRSRQGRPKVESFARNPPRRRRAQYRAAIWLCGQTSGRASVRSLSSRSAARPYC